MKRINTDKYEKIIDAVYIDDRENKRKDYGLKQYVSLNPSIQHLDIGDYIFKGNDIEVVFEYKTGADFISSINNNHLHNQVLEMTSNYEYTFIIVVTENLQKDIDKLYYSTGRDMTTNQINGALSTFNTVSTVLYAQSTYQAFDLMMRMAGKIIEQKPLKYKYGKKSNNYALNILSGMKGLDNIADKIVNTLNISTLEDVMNLTLDDLTSVDKIGEKKALTILKNIHSDL